MSLSMHLSRENNKSGRRSNALDGWDFNERDLLAAIEQASFWKLEHG